MGDVKPTDASAQRVIKLVVWTLFMPDRFQSEEEVDSEVLNTRPQGTTTGRVYKIRRAFGQSFLWCVSAVLTGLLLGWLALSIIGASPKLATATIICGTTVLLWATLALQGWEIQSFSGATLGERLNRWLFRSLYSVGTAFIVAGSYWTLTPA